MAVDKDVEFLKRRKLTKEDMEREIEYLSFGPLDGEEFPDGEVHETLKQLNLLDNPRYRYDTARDAP